MEDSKYLITEHDFCYDNIVAEVALVEGFVVEKTKVLQSVMNGLP